MKRIHIIPNHILKRVSQLKATLILHPVPSTPVHDMVDQGLDAGDVSFEVEGNEGRSALILMLFLEHVFAVNEISDITHPQIYNLLPITVSSHLLPQHDYSAFVRLRRRLLISVAVEVVARQRVARWRRIFYLEFSRVFVIRKCLQGFLESVPLLRQF